MYIFKACTNIRYDKYCDSHVLCWMQSETCFNFESAANLPSQFYNKYQLFHHYIFSIL